MNDINNSILIDKRTKEKLTLSDVKSIIKKEYDSNGITFSEQHIASWSPMDRNKNDYIQFPSDFKYRQGFDLGHNSNTDVSTKEERDYMDAVLSDLKKYVKELNSTLDKESLTYKYFDENLYFSKGGSAGMTVDDAIARNEKIIKELEKSKKENSYTPNPKKESKTSSWFSGELSFLNW